MKKRTERIMGRKWKEEKGAIIRRNRGEVKEWMKEEE